MEREERRGGGGWGVYIVVDGHGGFNPMASLAAKELRKGERRRNWGQGECPPVMPSSDRGERGRQNVRTILSCRNAEMGLKISSLPYKIVR